MNTHEQITAVPWARVASLGRPRVLLVGSARHLARVRSRLAELGFACSSRERASQGPEAADAILLVSRLADRGGAGLDEEFVDHDASPPVFAVPAVRPDAATEAVLRQTGVAGVFTWPGDLGALENSLVRLLHDRCDASPADVALEERVRADVKRRLASVESKRIRIRAREGKVVELDVQDRRPDPWSH